MLLNGALKLLKKTLPILTQTSYWDPNRSNPLRADFNSAHREDASLALLTIAVSPVIVHAMPHLLVNGRHGFHVAFSPLTPQVFGLDFQQFEDIQLHHGLLHLQSSFQYWGRLKDYQHLSRNQQKLMQRAQESHTSTVCAASGANTWPCTVQTPSR